MVTKTEDVLLGEEMVSQKARVDRATKNIADISKAIEYKEKERNDWQKELGKARLVIAGLEKLAARRTV